MVQPRVLITLCLHVVLAMDTGMPQPPLVHSLNTMIARGLTGVYTGGKGVLIRSPNVTGVLRVDNMKKVVAAMLLVDDIQVPNIMYPSLGPGGAECPNVGKTGYGEAVACPPDENGETGPWNYAQLGYVVGSKRSHFLPDFDKIQNTSWNEGVFYATSANSDKMRCRWLPQYKGYDCPGYWLPWNAKGFKDESKGGAQSFPPGNPEQNPDVGGGAGCHFATYDPLSGIDQTDAPDPNNQGVNLVADPHCSCNIGLRSGGSRPWDAWVQQWMRYANAKPNFKWQGWFQGGKAPSFALDFSACWMKNPRDMILMQNAVWRRAHEWSNQMVPTSDWRIGAPTWRSYWGWNEVPLSNTIDQPKFWDAIVIKLPLAVCGYEGGNDTTACMGTNANRMLETHLKLYIAAGFLKVGKASYSVRPGSSVVFLREVRHKLSYWTRDFFCEPWSSPSGDLQVVHSRESCFVDDGSQHHIMI